MLHFAFLGGFWLDRRLMERQLSFDFIELSDYCHRAKRKDIQTAAINNPKITTAGMGAMAHFTINVTIDQNGFRVPDIVNHPPRGDWNSTLSMQLPLR